MTAGALTDATAATDVAPPATGAATDATDVATIAATDAAAAVEIAIASTKANEPEDEAGPAAQAIEGTPAEWVDEVRREIAAGAERYSESRPQVVQDVSDVLDRLELGEMVVTVGATDAECLVLVWRRASDPRNAAHKNRIQQAVFDALADCWEDGLDQRHIVCVNGRTGRLLAALVLLDWDERNWVIKTIEQLKNDVFAAAKDAIEEVALKAADSPDLPYAAAGRNYLAADARDLVKTSEDAERRLSDSMRAAITAACGDIVDSVNARSPGAVPLHLAKSVLAEALAAV
jgi:hypothetical protein